MVKDLSNNSMYSVIGKDSKVDDVNNELDNQMQVLEVNNSECVNEELSNKEKTNDENEFVPSNCGAENAEDDVIMSSSNLIRDNKIKLIKSIGDRSAYYLVQEISLSQYNAILAKKYEDKRNNRLLNIDLVSSITNEKYSHSSKKKSSTTSQGATRNKRFEMKDDKKKNDWKINSFPFVKLNKLFIGNGTISITTVTETVKKKIEVISTKTDNNKSFRIIKRQTKLLKSKEKDVSSIISTNAKKSVSNSKKIHSKRKNWTEQSSGKKSNRGLKLENKNVSKDDLKGLIKDLTPQCSITNIDNVKVELENQIKMDEINRSLEDMKSNAIKNYKCYMCKNGFRSIKLFKKHIKIHIESEFICTECNKSYKYLSSLKNHLLIFHDNKKIEKTFKGYTCGHCPFRTNTRNNLLQHRIIHTRTHAQYTCDVCDAKYAIKYWFLKHKLIHK